MAPKASGARDGDAGEEDVVPLVRSRAPAVTADADPEGGAPAKSPSVSETTRPPNKKLAQSNSFSASGGAAPWIAAIKSIRPVTIFAFINWVGLLIAVRYVLSSPGGDGTTATVMNNAGGAEEDAAGSARSIAMIAPGAAAASAASEARLTGGATPGTAENSPSDVPAEIASSSAGTSPVSTGDTITSSNAVASSVPQPPSSEQSLPSNKLAPPPADQHLPPYGDLSCPLEDPIFSASALVSRPWYNDQAYLQRTGPHAETRESFLARGESARGASEASHTPLRIRAGMRRGFEGKIVLVGGEDMRQYFISLGCLGGITPGAYTAPWRSEEGEAARASGGKAKLDAKFILPEEKGRRYGEVLYSPLAGHLLTYEEEGRSLSRGKMLVHEQSKSWLEACRKGEPFTYDMYSYRKNGAPGPVKTAKLFATDTVFLTAGTDPRTRSRNIGAIVELMDCVEGVRRKGWLSTPRAAKDWPRLRYVMTSLSHYGAAAGKCERENYSDRHQAEDEKLFNERSALPEDGRPFRPTSSAEHGEDKAVLVAEDVNLANHGDMHVRGEFVDCESWFQPGVPDVVAAEIVESVVGRINADEVAEELAGDGAVAKLAELGRGEVAQGQVMQQMQQQAQVPQERPQTKQAEARQGPQLQEQSEIPEAKAQGGAQSPQTKKTVRGMSTPEALLESCPFTPDASRNGANLDPNLMATMAPSFDGGLLTGLRKILGKGRDKAVLDLTAGAGQLRSSLDHAGWLIPQGVIDYVGFDQYLNLEQLVGQTVTLGDGAQHVVPPLCWADPSRPFDLARKFDLVLAVVGPGQFVRRGGEEAFLDNLVRAAGNRVVVAWNTVNNGNVEVMKEMERRGMEYDGKLTRQLRGSAGRGGWIGKSLEVYKFRQGVSKPLAGERI